MDDIELKVKYIELRVQNDIALRTYCNTAAIAITGGLIGLLFHLSVLNVCLFVIGMFIDYKFILRSCELSKEIYILTSKIKDLK